MNNWIKKLKNSLSLKILFIFIITGSVLFITIRLTFALLVKQDSEQARKAQLPHYIEYLRREIGTPPNIEKAKKISENDHIVIYIEGPKTHWASSGVFPNLTKTRFLKTEWPEISIEESLKESFSLVGFFNEESRLVKIRHDQYIIYFDAIDLLHPVLSSYLDMVILCVALIILFFCYKMVQKLIFPLTDIKNGAIRLAQGDFDYRFNNIGQDELGELSQTMNYLADQVKKMLAAKRQLLLAISHELRSPLTRSKIALEFLDDSKAKTALADDIDVMQKLISDLLEAERLESPHAELQLKELSLNKLINEVLTDFFSKQLDLIKATLPETPIIKKADGARLKFLIKNLLDNALRHSPDKSTIELMLRTESNNIVLEVIDHGEGIAPEHLPHLTQPFYRADAARQRRTGGYGLGLYLSQLIVAAHGGQLSFSSELGKGTTVQVRLPKDTL